MRCRSLAAMIVGVLLIHGCGDGSSPVAPPADASPSFCVQEAAVGDGAACSPLLPDCWTPKWKPPRPPVAHACTDAQILDEVTKLFGDTFDLDCQVFERDPVNAACLGCIFSTSDEASYGAV